MAGLLKGYDFATVISSSKGVYTLMGCLLSDISAKSNKLSNSISVILPQSSLASPGSVRLLVNGNELRRQRNIECNMIVSES